MEDPRARLFEDWRWPRDEEESACLFELLLSPIPRRDEVRHRMARSSFLMRFLLDRNAYNLFELWAERFIRSNPKGPPATLPFPPPEEAVREAEEFVRALGLPWPWLARALARFLFFRICLLYGRPFPYWAFGVTGLPVRWRPKSRRSPKWDAQHIAEWAAWLYRVRVYRQSVRALAMERHAEKKHPRPFEDCDCRRTVRLGLKEAERLLATPE